VDLQLPSGEYYYVPPTAVHTAAQRGRTGRGSVSSTHGDGLPQTPVGPVGHDAQVSTGGQTSSLAFSFANHTVMDDDPVPQIVKRRQSIQETIRSRRESSPYRSQSPPPGTPEDVRSKNEVHLSGPKSRKSSTLVSVDIPAPCPPMEVVMPTVVPIESTLPQTPAYTADHPVLADIALLRSLNQIPRPLVKKPATSGGQGSPSRRHSRPGSSPSALSRKLATASNSRVHLSSDRQSISSYGRRPFTSQALEPLSGTHMSVPLATALVQSQYKTGLASVGSSNHGVDTASSALRRSPTPSRSASLDYSVGHGSVSASTLQPQRRSTMDGQSGREAGSRSRVERADGILLINVESGKKPKNKLPTATVNAGGSISSNKGSVLRDWGYSMSSDD
jgi:hypothetical protein